MRDHAKLRAFELTDRLVFDVYDATRTFPDDERYGLTSQMRRAAVSVPSNIVEGCARESQSDYVRFLGMAYGSAKELQYQASLSHRLGYLSRQTCSALRDSCEEAARVLAAPIRSLRRGR